MKWFSFFGAIFSCLAAVSDLLLQEYGWAVAMFICTLWNFKLFLDEV